MNLLHRTILTALVATQLTAAALSDDNWPRFRGPLANGVATGDLRLPEQWSTEKNVVWVRDVPGRGWSGPIVWGNRVFLTAVVNDQDYEAPKKGLYLGRGREEIPAGEHHWLVYCFDLNSGELLWKHEAHRGEPQIARHPKSTYAAETPVTDGQRVYALFGDVGLYCYDLQGTPLWSHAIGPKKTFFGYGAAASPVVHDGQVIMVYDNQEQSYIAAFDGETGQQRWRTERDEKSTWATPLVWQNEHRSEIVVPGKRKIRSYDLGGNVLWELQGQMSNLVIPSPFASLGMVFIASGYVGDKDRPVYAIKAGASGDITLEDQQTSSEYVAWFQPQAGPYNTSPMVYGDYYYTLHDRGFVTCHLAKTGEEVYGKQRFAPGASFTSSPWAYNGRLFFLSEDGETYVLEAGPDYKLLHTNSLGEFCMASPAISQGRLLIRTASKLYCISNDAP